MTVKEVLNITDEDSVQETETKEENFQIDEEWVELPTVVVMVSDAVRLIRNNSVPMLQV